MITLSKYFLLTNKKKKKDNIFIIFLNLINRFSTTTTTELSGEGQGALQVHLNLSEPQQPVGLLQQKRHGRQEIPRIYNNREIESSMQTVPSNRQANPDIQDIITGIVKLLNGNVNVAVNTVRPLKPIQATR